MAKYIKFNIQEGIYLVNSKWTENLANMIHDLANTSRDDWKDVTTLKKLIQGHHTLPGIVRLKNKMLFCLKLMKKI